MDMLAWAIGLAVIIGVYIVNAKRGNRTGSHYQDGFYHGGHHADHTASSSHDGGWGGRDMSHDHHSGRDSDSGSDGGWGGDGGGDSGGGDGGGGDGGGGGE